MPPLQSSIKHKARRKSSRYLICIVAIIVLSSFLLACKDQSFLKEEEKKQPAESSELELPDSSADLKLIVELLELDQPAELYKKVHPEALKRYGSAEIIDRHQKIHQNLGITSVVYEELELINSLPDEAKEIYQARVKIQTGLGLIDKKESFSLLFNPQSGRWELLWRPSVIIPGLHEQGTVRVRELLATRGEIFDSKGQALAENAIAYRLGIVPQDYDRDLDHDLADFLKIDVEKIEEALSASWVKEDSFVPLITKAEISSEDYAELRKYKLKLESVATRHYPLGEAASILIGYVGQASETDLQKSEYADLKSDQMIGKAGLEAIFDQQLRGKNGYQLYITGAEEIVLIEEEMLEGEDLHLTIDADLQAALHKKLSEPTDSFTAVAIDPDDGSIRALISTPAYDPQLFVRGISSAEYQDLLDNPDLPLYNKFNALYTPGSTHKVISALNFLAEGVIEISDKLQIEGKSWQKDGSWGKYKIRRVEQIEEELNLHDALVYSDNIFFAQMALLEGAEQYIRGLEKLGLGAEFKTAYPFFSSKISATGQLESDILLADTAYGQGELQIAPLDLAAIYSALINGEIPEPKLLQDEDFPLRAEVKISKPELKNLRSAMREVVTLRYPGAMERKGLEIAGKSGTAELGLDEDDKMTYNSWFVGYDQKDPRVILALCLFNAQEHEKSYCHESFADCLELIKEVQSSR